MKRILTGIVMGVILIAACALTAVVVAKNRTLSVGIRAATAGMGDASVSELGDVKPYPPIEFAEKHAYDLGGQAYLWFYGRWRMILEERDFVLKNGAEINSLLKYRDPPTAEDEIYVTPNLDVLNIVSFFDLAEQPQILTIPPIEDGRYYTFMFVDAWHTTSSPMYRASIIRKAASRSRWSVRAGRGHCLRALFAWTRRQTQWRCWGVSVSVPKSRKTWQRRRRFSMR